MQPQLQRQLARLLTQLRQLVERVVDLTDPAANRILNMSVEQARERILRSPAGAVRQIEGSFALVAKEGKVVRLARSLDRPMRYFLAKRQEGLPALRELVEAGEYRRVRELAHDIKGTGLGYGFPPLTDAARELEAAAAGSDLEHMRNALLQMEEYVSAVEIEPGG